MSVNKPVGKSSYDVVRRVKKILDFKKVGHGGTLDPFADGVLIILIGRGATRQMNEILQKSKIYRAVLVLGNQRDTGDIEGQVVKEMKIPEISDEMLKKTADKFVGVYEQMPPQYSAKKVNGRPAYKYARKGIKVELKPKKVEIYKLVLKKIDDNKIEIQVECSSGTYIRVLGEEIAETFGTVGYLEQLTRESIGEYTLANAADFDQLDQALTDEKRILMNTEEVSIN